MLLILSPSKTLDTTPRASSNETSNPVFLSQAAHVAELMKKLSPKELRSILGISESLAVKALHWYQAWTGDHKADNTKAACLTFKGDVYQGLKAEDFSLDDLVFAQKHLRILSALYGYLKPLDRFQPHRLEMASPLHVPPAKNLYEFWKNIITHEVQDEIHTLNHACLVNLASKEYSDVIDFKKIDVPVIQPVFLEYSSGSYRTISIYAKKARGLMARFIIRNRIQSVEELKLFNLDGYYFSVAMSQNHQIAFVR